MKKTAWLSRKLPDKKVECLACHHRCKIAEGKTGICGVRANEGGELKLLVFGRAASANVDPIEKKPLFHFLPGTQIFSFGTVGCNFRCSFCQNFEISQFSKSHSRAEIEKFGVNLPPEKIVEICVREKISAIAYTYNEPAVFFEYAFATAKLAHEKGIRNVFVTSGFESREALEKIHPLLDAVNVDLKSFRDDFYIKICGGRLQPVLENIRWLHANKIWLEVTTLVIPRGNDSENELREIAEFIAGIDPEIPWHISRYFPCFQMRNPPTPIATLEKAAEIGKQAGLKNIYVGNISHSNFENTICPKCGEVVIRRSGYFTENFLAGDRCKNCGGEIAGVFEKV
ncbi:AmmeMemoRadiSam system radical SAM enzyme [Patescibacteria group bacterium]|nr:AmmeMemoRadiSam system radical SAM enzyme [Patescibacteria group bacterium]